MENKEKTINPPKKEGDLATINLFVHDIYELQIERLEKHLKRLFVLCICLIVALVVSNVAWLLYESQYEDVVVTQSATSDSGGDAHIGAGAGSVYFGSDEGATIQKGEETNK